MLNYNKTFKLFYFRWTLFKYFRICYLFTFEFLDKKTYQPVKVKDRKGNKKNKIWLEPTWKKLQCVASCSWYLPLYYENHQWVLQMNRAGVDLCSRHSLLHPPPVFHPFLPYRHYERGRPPPTVVPFCISMISIRMLCQGLNKIDQCIIDIALNKCQVLCKIIEVCET